MTLQRTTMLIVTLFGLLGTGLSQGPFTVRENATLLTSQFPDVDDIVIMSSGDTIIARPDLQSIGVVDLNTFAYTPLPLAPVISVAMTESPSGELFFSDTLSGTILSYDFTTQSIRTIASGFFIPLDIVFWSHTDLYICDLTTVDFFFGVCKVWHIDLAPPVPTQTLVVDNIPGAADIEFLGSTMFIGSLGTPILGAYDMLTGVGVPLAVGIIRPTDIVVLDANTLLVCALLGSRVATVDVNTGLITDLVYGLGASGQGAEDLAMEPGGDALLTIKTGEVYRLDLTSKLRQVGNAVVGSTVNLQVDNPSQAQSGYTIGVSDSSNYGFLLGGAWIPLDPDPTFYATLPPRPYWLVNFDGVLDSTGKAMASIIIPSLPALAGHDFNCAAVFYDTIQPLPLQDVSDALRITIDL